MLYVTSIIESNFPILCGAIVNPNPGLTTLHNYLVLKYGGPSFGIVPSLLMSIHAFYRHMTDL